MEILPTSDKCCVNCKHLIGVRTNTISAENWQCGHPTNIVGFDAVSGLRQYSIKSCYTQRDVIQGLCKGEGLLYEEYIKPHYADPPSVDKPHTAKIGKTNFETTFATTDLNDVAAAAAARVEAIKNKKKGIKPTDLENL